MAMINSIHRTNYLCYSIVFLLSREPAAGRTPSKGKLGRMIEVISNMGHRRDGKEYNHPWTKERGQVSNP